MTSQDRAKITKRMLWIIPAMLLCILGDYCMGIASSGGWIVLVLKGVLPLKKTWVLAAPLLVAGIGFLLEWILPLPFNGFASGFESLGWIGMFLGGIQAIKKDERMDNR